MAKEVKSNEEAKKKSAKTRTEISFQPAKC